MRRRGSRRSAFGNEHSGRSGEGKERASGSTEGQRAQPEGGGKAGGGRARPGEHGVPPRSHRGGCYELGVSGFISRKVTVAT